MEISLLTARQAEAHLARLSEILRHSVEGGALVGYVLPFDIEQSRAYWLGVVRSVEEGERLLYCAIDDGEIIGSAQLYLSPEPNAPHRAEIYKLLVHRDFQRRGVGAALMRHMEAEALRLGRSLLLLDTVAGGAGERLYRRLGWQEVGTVPKHFVDPHGNFKSSVYFMKLLD